MSKYVLILLECVIQLNASTFKQYLFNTKFLQLTTQKLKGMVMKNV